MARVRLVFLGLLIVVPAAFAGDARITGTYSSLEYHRESGDLIGLEIRVVQTHDGYKASVQVAEGGAGDIVVVPFKTFNGNVSFDVPYGEGKPARFTGSVTEKGLAGTIKYPSGTFETIFLPRKKSYWD
jgi:hypothetical protein